MRQVWYKDVLVRSPGLQAMNLKDKPKKEDKPKKKKDNTLLYGLGVVIIIVLIILIIRTGKETPPSANTYTKINYENCLLVNFEPKPVTEPKGVACDNTNCCTFEFSGSVCQAATCYKR